jgi:hypothetical protein
MRESLGVELTFMAKRSHWSTNNFSNRHLQVVNKASLEDLKVSARFCSEFLAQVDLKPCSRSLNFSQYI